jgi:hypothetical protein
MEEGSLVFGRVVLVCISEEKWRLEEEFSFPTFQ